MGGVGGEGVRSPVYYCEIAEVCAEALFNPKATNVTFECVAHPGGASVTAVTQDFFQALMPDEV